MLIDALSSGIGCLDFILQTRLLDHDPQTEYCRCPTLCRILESWLHRCRHWRWANFNIFYNKALTILAVLQWAATLDPLPKRLVIHTDSGMSFHIFNSLHAFSLYNLIIFSSVKIQLAFKIDLQVFLRWSNSRNVVPGSLVDRSNELPPREFNLPEVPRGHMSSPSWKQQRSIGRPATVVPPII